MPHAIVFPEPRAVEVRDVGPSPALQPTDVRVRTELCGVSQGTELWALMGNRHELEFPTIPGYQAVGIVQEVGAEVAGLVEGDRVVLHHARTPDGMPDTWMGTHQSELIAPTGNNPPPLKVPDSVEPEEAVLAAMAAVSLRGVQMLDVKLGDVGVVLGQGLIGQASAQWLRSRGAFVIAADLAAKRVELSQAYSADVAVDPTQADLKALVHKHAPDGANIIIDATGRAKDFALWIDLLRVGGQVLMQGYYPDPISFDFFATHLKRPTVAIPCGIGDTGLTLDTFARKRLNWKPMVTHHVPIARAPDLYQRMLDGDNEMLGVVFDWRDA